MSDTSADTLRAAANNPTDAEAAAILLESPWAQHVLDGLGLCALAAGTAWVLSVPEAVIVTASVAVLTITARRLRVRSARHLQRTGVKDNAPQVIAHPDTSVR